MPSSCITTIVESRDAVNVREAFGQVLGQLAHQFNS